MSKSVVVKLDGGRADRDSKERLQTPRMGASQAPCAGKVLVEWAVVATGGEGGQAEDESRICANQSIGSKDEGDAIRRANGTSCFRFGRRKKMR
jgi:hypothetical protein